MTGILDAIARVSLAPPPSAAKVDILAQLDALAPKPKRAVVSIVEPRDERPVRGAALQDLLAKMRKAEPSREQWPSEWFSRNDPADGVRCQRMWAECLRVSLLDVCETYCKDCDLQAAWDKTPEVFRKTQRPEVRVSWVGSADFHQVCALAGLDGEAVASRVKAKLVSRAGAVAMGLALSAAVRATNGGGHRHVLREGGDD